MVPAIPLINGNRYSFASIEFRIPQIGARRYIGLKAINYTDDLQPGDVYGTAPQKIGRTNGKSAPTANMEIYALEFDDLVQNLVASAVARGYPPNVGFMQVSFDIIVAYADIGAPVIVDTIFGARITKPDKQRQEGSDPLSVRCDLNIMAIDHNGVAGVQPIMLLGT
jgi:hypothetical protein